MAEAPESTRAARRAQAPRKRPTRKRAPRKRPNRWERPLNGFGDRVAAWLNAFFVDHAFIRLVYLNRHRITPRAWRSAQPAPHQIRAMARDGIRTIVSLRGGQTFGSLPLEKAAAKEAGMTYRRFVLRSRSLPSREELLALKEFLERIEYPALFHCKSGADRAGFMSALYLALQEGVPVRKAAKQLSRRYGHIRHGKTGVLDAFFDAYLAETRGKIPLLGWIENGYDRERIQNAFKPTRAGGFLTETLLDRE